ncbi:MAG: protein adenylyltransferase SelO family protein [Chromatiales bacterium]|nr:protein adenylyltransferase SelO family protein [Chromatiales bacterium]
MSGRCSQLHLLDGSHPLRDAVPDGYVDYPARRRRGARVALFNFDLAREANILPPDHPDVLDRQLRDEIIAAFSLQIVNEYDEQHNPGAMRRAGPRRFMATRYLQIQHPDRKGRTSGDGRSIWNGVLSGQAGAWDISSCGTGATRLSPATAIHGKFFRTGDSAASYGCGRAQLWDALCAALMSEVLHGHGVRTERTLAILDYGDGSCVAVRAYPNLMRPAHLFHWLKQGDLSRLRAAVDYYIARETADGRLPHLIDANARYQYLLDRVADDFARAAAQFESEYIFCWLEWDGDNVLLDGGIIDYGSVRQFGLYHREYRYDDVERMSTTIAEQRLKARYIVQTMAQLVDYLIHGYKQNIQCFRNAPALARFDQHFLQSKHRLLAERIGFDPEQCGALCKDHIFQNHLAAFASIYWHFERTQSLVGPYRVADGITRDAIFCMRDLLRELPQHYLELGVNNDWVLPAEDFLELMRSRYACERDLRIYPARRSRIRRFQQHYGGMIRRAAELQGNGQRSYEESGVAMLRKVARRSAVLNRYERITGDGVLRAAKKLIDSSNAVKEKELYAVFRGFVETYQPHLVAAASMRTASVSRVCDAMLAIARQHCEGL